MRKARNFSWPESWPDKNCYQLLKNKKEPERLFLTHLIMINYTTKARSTQKNQFSGEKKNHLPLNQFESDEIRWKLSSSDFFSPNGDEGRLDNKLLLKLFPPPNHGAEKFFHPAKTFTINLVIFNEKIGEKFATSKRAFRERFFCLIFLVTTQT